MTHTILFDFDGTLALGDGPILAFAHAIAERTGDAGFPTRAEAALEAFAAGGTDDRDGYDAVTRLGRESGVETDVIGASYDASRERIRSGDVVIHAPAELAGFLATVGTAARLVVATNAPAAGVTAVLRNWGVLDAFDRVHASVGKPDGLVPIVREAIADGPVLAVGDIAEFDLAPAAGLGADTAIVGAAASRSPFPATMRGRTLAELYEPIIAWTRTAVPSPIVFPTP